jgi:hypothetical protein
MSTSAGAPGVGSSGAATGVMLCHLVAPNRRLVGGEKTAYYKEDAFNVEGKNGDKNLCLAVITAPKAAHHGGLASVSVSVTGGSVGIEKMDGTRLFAPSLVKFRKDTMRRPVALQSLQHTTKFYHDGRTSATLSDLGVDKISTVVPAELRDFLVLSSLDSHDGVDDDEEGEDDEEMETFKDFAASATHCSDLYLVKFYLRPNVTNDSLRKHVAEANGEDDLTTEGARNFISLDWTLKFSSGVTHALPNQEIPLPVRFRTEGKALAVLLRPSLHRLAPLHSALPLCRRLIAMKKKKMMQRTKLLKKIMATATTMMKTTSMGFHPLHHRPPLLLPHQLRRLHLRLRKAARSALGRKPDLLHQRPDRRPLHLLLH